MSNIKSLNFAKIAIFALVALVVLSFAVLPALAYTHSVTLRQGSSGTQVMDMQTALNAAGANPMLTVDGKFGPMSGAAVMAYQTANGLTADGVVGPLTGAMLGGVTAGGTFPAGCTSASGYSTTTGESCASSTTLPAGCLAGYLFSSTTGQSCTGTTTPTGPLMGGAGSIEDADFVSSLTGEEVGEGANDVEVAGLDIDADDGSDLNLTAVRLDFTFGTADQDFEDYADEVSLWFEGEEVARIDSSSFTDQNNYDKTISLDGDAIIRAGGTGRLVVAVSGVNNLDTNDAGDTWTVEFESIRYEDASGAIITDSATGDINGVTRTFSFETFATSTDTELKITLKTGSAANAINKAHLINVHPTANTNNVKLLSFTLEAEGTSDIEIREFLADLVVTGATNVDGVIRGGTAPAARLFIDGEQYGTASYNEDGDGLAVGVDEEIFWDDVNYTIAAGTTVDAYIEVDLNDTTGTGGIDDMDEGDTILAQITATQRAALTDIDARDETGTQLAVADITGTAVGEASRVYDEIFTFTTDGWTNTAVIPGGAAGIDDQVTFSLEFTVTAVDGDIYIDDACTEDADGTMVEATNDGLGFNFYQSQGTAANVALTCSFTTTSGATAATSSWLVNDGTSETFKVSIHAVADTTASSFVS